MLNPPQGQSPHDCLKIYGSPRYLHYDWVDHSGSGSMHRNSSAKKIAHPDIISDTISALGGLTLEFSLYVG